jgi:hypothetical protein
MSDKSHELTVLYLSKAFDFDRKPIDLAVSYLAAYDEINNYLQEKSQEKQRLEHDRFYGKTKK